MKHSHTEKTTYLLNKESFKALKDKFGYKNPMQAPVLKKIVISSGTGSVKDKKKVELIADRLTKITGQKPAPRSSKKSIASFKVRQGDLVGYQITLRGKRMCDFVDKLVHIALPRTKDFRGISKTAVDSLGNMTIGIKEHTIFPETGDEEIVNVFGLAVTIVTSAKSRPEALAFFEYLGFPMKKEEEKKKPRVKRKR